MKIILTAILCLVLTSCASRGTQPVVTDNLWHDTLFNPASTTINPADALAISEPMRNYARSKLAHRKGRVNSADRRTALVEALYTKGDLRLDYDATQTLTAGQAFDAGRGNCLSLVLLTAAMARDLGLPYRFQQVIGMQDWNVSENLLMSIGHVNLRLDEIPSEFELKTWTANALTIDFSPPDQAAVLDTQEIGEHTVLAMFANNRAVENLILGNRDDAYWWSRAAIHADPEFAGALLTLAVIYRDSHHPEFAEEVLEQAVRRYPENAAILSNWIQVLKELGREAESIALTQQLLELEAQQPWSYYLKAQAEYGVGHFSNARALLEKELVRDPDRYVLNYALALVWLQLHDSVQASIYLERAIALCPVPQLRTRYRMQLARLKSEVGRGGRGTFSNRILLSGGALVLAKPHRQ